MKTQRLHHLIFRPDKPCHLILTLAALLGGALLALSFLRSSTTTLSCGGGGRGWWAAPRSSDLAAMDALVHYATSSVVPQQSLREITVAYEVLKAKLVANDSCNFLVFGLGRDSMMWAGLNPRGKTLFLEEDPKWVQEVLKDAGPSLRAQTVRYRTQLKEADELIRHYADEPDCSAERSFIRGNEKCRLALNMLSDEVYDTQWDLIMIDAPRGYFPEAPGRMAAIYSAAVMARRRSPGMGPTHVFLHDVDRVVEKTYANKFLCKKYLVKAVGRLWHFEIPPAAAAGGDFC